MERAEKKVLLQVNDIKKDYLCSDGTTTHALRGVTLDIREGEVLGLLGANGAGKTTMASLLVTLHLPTAGEILFKGQPIYDDLYAYRRQIGYCPQKANLYSRLTIRENLMFAGRFFGMPEDEIKARSEELIERFSLTPYVNQHMDALSGGYKQRASIARAMIHSPRLIFFDEPTVGLDPHIRRQLWREIEGLKNDGVAVVLTTHYLDEAEYLSDYVYFIDKGRMKASGSPSELKTFHQKGTLEEVMVKLMEEEVAV